MDTAPPVIDITDAALARHRAATCALCPETDDLYRLVGTADPLCRDCFVEIHAPSA